MPGVIPHLLTGFLIFLIGIYVYQDYFDNINKRLILGFCCIFFTILPDSILVLYYLTHFQPKILLFPYHTLFHQIVFFVSLILIIFIQFIKNLKLKPLINLSLICIIAHYILDLFVVEVSIWI